MTSTSFAYQAAPLTSAPICSGPVGYDVYSGAFPSAINHIEVKTAAHAWFLVPF